MTATLEVPELPEGFKDRNYHYRDRLDRLMRMDFDMLNAVLGVELNTQMSPLVMQAVLRLRTNELSYDERQALPGIVVEVILAIDGDHMAKVFSKYLKKKPKKEPEGKKAETVEAIVQPALKEPQKDRVKLTYVEGGVALFVEGLKPTEIMKHLTSTKTWVSWCFYSKVQPRTTLDGLHLLSPMFAEFSLQEIRGLFREQFGL